MKIRLACVAALAAVACSSSSTRGTPALDGGRSPDDAASTSPLDGSSSPDDAASTSADASGSACFPGGVSPDAAAPIGALCLPVPEKDPTFAGYDFHDLGVESQPATCASGTCLINHFEGRVSCPSGQSAGGQGPDGSPGCKTPGTCAPVTAAVAPQCAVRAAQDTVYCSCRCANLDGRTDDGATYCTCPGTMTCVQLVSSLGDPDASALTAITGAYCVKSGTEYDGGPGCQ